VRRIEQRTSPGTLCALIADGVRRFAALSVCAQLLFTAAGAHEIPSDVTVRIIVHPSDAQLEVLVRVPLEAMQDMTFPTLGPGYLDLERADSQLRDAAIRWLADDIEVYADGSRLPRPRLVVARASIPSDRSGRRRVLTCSVRGLRPTLH
jgi:hypothetical protein